MKKKFLVTILSLAACAVCGVALGACNKESPKPELSSITFIASDGTQNTVYSYVYADDLEVVDVSKGSVALTYTDGSSTTRAVSDFAGGELAMSYTFSPLTGDAAIQAMWKDKIMASKGDAAQARRELADQYEAEVADGVNAAVAGLVDDVIDPADTRKMVIAALELLSSKRDSNPPKEHGNMAL